MKILFLLGAGVSVPSGIPSFNGIGKGEDIDKRIFHKDFLINNKEYSINKYKELLKEFNSKNKNYYHSYINDISKKHSINIISQNIDNLDNDLDNIIKIHGDINKKRCINNHYCKTDINKEIGELCSNCGDIIVPDILYYGEFYKNEYIKELDSLEKEFFDFFIIIGTNLDIPLIKNFSEKINSANKININPILVINDFRNYKTFNDFNDDLGFILE